jgi:hypothetical protein
MFWFRNLVLVAILSVCATHGYAQSLSGIRIGDEIASADQIGFAPVERNQSGPFAITKWRLPDKNELSITSATNNGKIVYIECDWGRLQSGTYTDFPGLYYGRTSLADIRQRFGNNGFAYGNRTGMRSPDNSFVMFNSYEVENANEVVVTFITKIAPSDIKSAKPNPAMFAKLDSIILGDAQYLRNIWGSQLVFDPAYHKIAWR